MQQIDRTGMVQSVRTRFSLAQVNAGATVVAAAKGQKHRLVDLTIIAVGGAAGNGTSVDIIGTRSASAVRLVVALIAALTENTPVKPTTANVSVLAAGATYTQLDENTAITIGKQSGGSDIDTASSFDVILSWATEEA